MRCNRLLKEKFACYNVIMQELFTEVTKGNLITGKKLPRSQSNEEPVTQILIWHMTAAE